MFLLRNGNLPFTKEAAGGPAILLKDDRANLWYVFHKAKTARQTTAMENREDMAKRRKRGSGKKAKDSQKSLWDDSAARISFPWRYDQGSESYLWWSIWAFNYYETNCILVAENYFCRCLLTLLYRENVEMKIRRARINPPNIRAGSQPWMDRYLGRGSEPAYHQIINENLVIARSILASKEK